MSNLDKLLETAKNLKHIISTCQQYKFFYCLILVNNIAQQCNLLIFF